MLKIASMLALFIFAFSTVAFAAPVITVVNDTKLGSITFGYASYKIINGSSTRSGSGATISVDSQAQFSSFPPLKSGDQIHLDRGLKIYNQKRSMTSDGSATCDAGGFASGISGLFGRDYMLEQDRFSVQVTSKEGVIPGIYDAVCTYSR
jgi:hypothetical protein